MAKRRGKTRPLSIRPYDSADRDALIDLWQRSGLVNAWNDPDDDIALASSCPNSEIFVGEHKDTIAASCLVGHDGHRGWLYYLASDPDHRHRGFGRALVRHCESWLTEHKVPKVQLMLRPSNLATKAFYAKLGYAPNPCHLMQRWLVDRGAPEAVSGARADGKLSLTVTFLEMTEAPRQAPLHPPRGRKVALLRAQRPTVAFYRFLYERVGERWLWAERRALADDELATIIQSEQVEIYVLYQEGVPAGFAEIERRSAADINLAYFGLMPEFMGQGLGGFLLTAVLDIAWSYEPSRLTLSTNSLDHPKALRLYQRFGFKATHRTDQLVDDPRLTGLIPLQQSDESYRSAL